MTNFIRGIFNLVISIVVVQLVQGFFQRRLDRGQEASRVAGDIDMKACPVCGVYTAMPCSNCQ